MVPLPILRMLIQCKKNRKCVSSSQRKFGIQHGSREKSAHPTHGSKNIDRPHAFASRNGRERRFRYSSHSFIENDESAADPPMKL
eukprot:768143-Hanusia_phi.AAC.2